MSKQETRLKIAIQKSGRLAEQSSELLERCGIKLTKSRDQLFCKARNFPLDVLYVRDDDIPAFVAKDVCQVGIVGQNVLFEKQDNDGENDAVETLLPLGFGRCRLSLAVPKGVSYDGVKSLQGKTIATSYKNVLRTYLNDNKVDAKIVTMQGAVEIAPRTGMADLICDLVSTGSTLATNGLEEVEEVLHSQAVLIASKQLKPEERELLDRLMMRLNGVLSADSRKYIMLNSPVSALEDVKRALPGSEAPTVVPLMGREDMVAVHAVCEEEVFWDTMEDLKSCGASAILVLPIEKMLD